MAEPNPMNCGARTRDGTPCDKSAGWGTNHPGHGRCRFHGGSSPRAEIAGQVALAHREYQVMGAPVDVPPHEALLECIRIAAGEVAYASEQIARLDPEEAVGSVVTVTRRPLKEEKGAESMDLVAEEVRTESPQLHIWIQVRRQAMDRLVTYSATALKAGLEERLVRVAEQQGQLLAQAVRGILEELGVADRPEVPAVVRKHLTLAAGPKQLAT
jgi:hypothetical protein